MKKITLGILAHVDSGKTTLSEALLYETGKIKKIGRVDHKDTFFDNYDLEKQRGITIFSKQAELEYKNTNITVLDTPGHVDFSAEMERTLQVLDYGILVVSGSEGVQGHTETLWKLLEKYNIPTFIFVNKMDMPGTNKEFVFSNLKHKFGDGIIDFSADELDMESIAMCDEEVLDIYMEEGKISDQIISDLIAQRKLFPCFCGSALKNEGVNDLLDGIDKYGITPIFHQEFGAKIFKITKDNGIRLTHMKITGGSIKVKDIINGTYEGEDWSEKINDIRIYSGDKFKSVNQAEPGMVCAISGLNYTYAGQGLGIEKHSEKPNLQPVLSYKIIIPDDVNVNQAYKMLKELEEEDPTLSLKWNEEKREILANVMGQIQIQILKHIIKERFDMDVEFGTGSILYKETITDTVEGVGHFEPLKHYAEVHLLMEPGQIGSGITFESNLNESLLSRNWQRLIMTHLAEKEHRGVLTGSPITDIHFSLVAGKAHLKHTEGGDFREATYRAVRQGLKKAKSVLLEPYYNFVLSIPSNNVGRAMTDINQMHGNMNPPEIVGDMSVITGYAPVSTIGEYINTVNEYTHGTGNLTLNYKGYGACHNADEIIESYNYDSESDLQNPTGSVFCSHGAGVVIPWDEVEQHMHIKTDLNNGEMYDVESYTVKSERLATNQDSYATDKELEEIFEKTFGPIKRKQYTEKKTRTYNPVKTKTNAKPKLPECVLVDGYNIVFAWDELKELARENIDGARDKLLDILSNYQGYKGNTVIVVFDAYNVKKHTESISKYQNLYVVYTKTAETADMYIAKTTHKLANKFQVTVATSDALEQLIIMGHGALRMSASNFKEEVNCINKAIEENISRTTSLKNYVIKDE